MSKPNSRGPALVDSEGNRVPSVSTILRKFQDPSNLLNWAWKMGQSGKSLQSAREEQATAGHASAARAMALLAGEALFDPTTYPSEVVVATDRPIEAFTAWVKRTGATVILREQPAVSPEYGYGGHVTTAIIEGTPVVLSLKAGKGVYLEDLLTAAACVHLVGTAGAVIVRFGKESGGFDECRSFGADELTPAWYLFRHLLDAYKHLKDVEDLMRGAA